MFHLSIARSIASAEVAGVAIFRFLNLRLGRRKFAITSPLLGFKLGGVDGLM